MKTYQEIRKAIDEAQRECLMSAASERFVAILHALNDRIEAIQTYCQERECDTKLITANIGSDLAKLQKVVTDLCNIHP